MGPAASGAIPTLPSPEAPTFFEDVRAADERYRQLERMGSLPDFPAAYRDIVDNASAPKTERSAALYLILMRLRQQRRYMEYRAEVDKYRATFSDLAIFETYWVVYYSWNPGDRGALRKSLQHARRAVNRVGQSPAVLHQFAQAVAAFVELQEVPDLPLVSEGLAAIETAIGGNPEQPNYYSVRARLLSLIGEKEAALEDVSYAIAIERPDEGVRPLRIAKYESIRTLINVRAANADLQDRIREFAHQAESVKGQMIEIAALLAAVVALIVSSVTISRSFALNDAVTLLFCTGGVVTIVLGAVTSLIVRQKLGRSITIAAIGVVLVLAGLVNQHL